MDEIHYFNNEVGESTNPTNATTWSRAAYMHMFAYCPSFIYIGKLCRSLSNVANFVQFIQIERDSTWQVEHTLICGENLQNTIYVHVELYLGTVC
jgi:hypothetical protein